MSTLHTVVPKARNSHLSLQVYGYLLVLPALVIFNSVYALPSVSHSVGKPL